MGAGLDESDTTRSLRLGTRGSALARAQSALVAGALADRGARVELVTVVTEGDLRPPDSAWGEGAFVGALERALLAGEVDVAVHSAKDVPIEPETALVVAAFPPRVDPRDVLVTRTAEPAAALADLPWGATVGTDSPRRVGFLRASRPDLRVVPLHGNVDTRLARLDRGEVDALVLAAAGLLRLGRADRIGAALAPDVLAPAPGQGALAVQVRADDAATRRAVGRLDDPATRVAVLAERAVLAATGGGCRAPLGALGIIEETADGPRLRLVAAAVDPDGSRLRSARRTGRPEEAGRLATEIAAELLAAGPVGAGR